MKKILYLGTSLSNFSRRGEAVHYPVIKLVPKSIEEERVLFCLKRLDAFSHCLVTSKNSVEILWDLCHQLTLDPIPCLQGKCICIGSITSGALRAKGVEPTWQSAESTQEGLIESFQGRVTKDAYVFYPRSSLARPLLTKYLKENSIPHETLDLYDTVYQEPLPKPCLSQIKEIVFTSPSTVEGFFKAFPSPPRGVVVSFQGPITQKKFYEKMEFSVD